jgi:hypothetical protein
MFRDWKMARSMCKACDTFPVQCRCDGSAHGRIANGNNPSGNQNLAGNSLKSSKATAAPCDVLPLEQCPLRAGKTSSTALMGDCETILFKS